MKKNRKKLPRYWLGTRKVTDVGYLQAQGIGNALFTSTPGENMLPEARAAEANLIPGVLAKGSPYLSTISSMYSTPGFFSSAGSSAATTGAEAGAEAGASTAASTTGAVAGKALGAVGAVIGAADIAQQAFHRNDHRSAGLMLDTRTTNQYVTPGGNSYTEYGGVSGNNELRLAKADTRSRLLNNLVSYTGEGATIGTMVAPGWGTLIGAGFGALTAGLQNAFGYGDTKDEVKEQIRRANDFTAMQNRLSRSIAESQDVKDAFYTRAANGKQPIATPWGMTFGKPNAKVSNGEIIGNFEDGRVTRVPGIKNNNDTQYANLKSNDFVISNKFGLSDYAASTGDYVGALNMLENLMKQFTNKYKCGKLPKYALGTWGEYALASLPHFGQYLESVALYNRAKKADTYVPQMEILNPYGARAINQVMSDMIDPREYLNQSMRNYNQAAWNTRRNPALGIGGRAVALDSLYKSKLVNDANTLLNIDQQNRGQRNMGAQMLEKYGNTILDKTYDQYWRRWSAQQQANAAKENWLAQYSKNKVMSGINAAADLLRVNQYNRANSIQERLIGLYEDQNKMRQAELDALRNTNNTYTPMFGGNPDLSAPLHPDWKFTPPSVLNFKFRS